jgi:hypothetical protein
MPASYIQLSSLRRAAGALSESIRFLRLLFEVNRRFNEGIS